ncbi:MAG: hypothetical protein KAI06_02330 [Anaerolineales bacterium]|nr:hypothetical protein [Anaerolineales bacterium]
MKSILRPRSFGILVLALILAASVYGFAAANTVPATYAGDGNGGISGYTISNIVYDLDSDGDPSDIDGVTFTLNAAASEVHITLDGSSWTSCTITGGTSISCTGLSQSVLTAASLRVIAAD